MKITEFYLDRAKYKAVDAVGNEILVEINYWENSYKLSHSNKKLEKTARAMLARKHRVNFVDKLLK